jgi:DNA replication and repair protein RecF
MITQLKANSFRCFESVDITFSPGINLILGDNGSGKTSILEMIYLLGRGRSFRTHHINDLVLANSGQSIVFATISNSTSVEQGQPDKIGCQIAGSQIKIKVNSEHLKRRSDLLDILPLQIITPSSHEIIDQGPSHRRKFIDWGLFHVEQNYRNDWSAFRKILKQRNQLLKNRCSRNELKHWDEQFAEYSQRLSNRRQHYFGELQPHFHLVQTSLLGDELSSLGFFQGWNNEAESLLQLLEQNYDRDVKLGWSSVGPHKADILFRFKDSRRNVLSRGQQKLLVFSLQIAQCLHLQEKITKQPLLLIDDVISELDRKHVSNVVDFLDSQNFQVIITATDSEKIHEDRIGAVFHVEPVGKSSTVNAVKS